MQSWLPGAASLADELRRAGVVWLQGGGAEVAPHEMMAVLERFHPKLVSDSATFLPGFPGHEDGKVPCGEIHGNLTQQERAQALDEPRQR